MTKFDDLPSDFWEEHISRSIHKNDITTEAWNKITKWRNSPIRLTKRKTFGDTRKPHIVFPKGCRGYLIDHPEVFNLSENDLLFIQDREFFDEIPAIICGFWLPVSLKDDEYEIIQPFFDDEIASFAEQHRIFDL